MGFLKDLFAGSGSAKKSGSCCDVRITEVKEQPTGNQASPSGSKTEAPSCCSN